MLLHERRRKTAPAEHTYGGGVSGQPAISVVYSLGKSKLKEGRDSEMDTIGPDEVLGNIRIITDEDADDAQVEAEAGRILEEIKMEMLSENTTPEMLNEYRRRIGDKLKEIDGVIEVKMTALLTGNPPKVVLGMALNTETGEVTVTEEYVEEGKPVPRPPWAAKEE